MARKVSLKRQLERARASRCPFCASEQTAYGSLSVEWGQCEQEVDCRDCERNWYEIYGLSNIAEQIADPAEKAS